MKRLLLLIAALGLLTGQTTKTWSTLDAIAPAVLPPGITYGLPPGLTLSSTGVISGTATTAGDYLFIVRVSDGVVSARRAFLMTVRPQDISITAPSGAMWSPTVGSSISFSLGTQ